MRLVVSIDVEPDAPPYLAEGSEGLEHGLPRVLDLLSRYGVHADCFVLGSLAAGSPEVARRLLQAGHTVGCHGWSHRLPFFRTRVSLRQEIARSVSAIEGATGQRPLIFRAPRFTLTPRLLAELLRAGFTADSSVLPHARIARARGRIVLLDTPEVPRRPYRVGPTDPWRPGRSSLVEVPATEFPPLRGSPVGLGTLHRFGRDAIVEAAEAADRAAGYTTFVIHPWEAADLRSTAAPRWLEESARADLSRFEDLLVSPHTTFASTLDLAREAEAPEA